MGFLSKLLNTINPLKLPEAIMQSIIQNALKKALSSLIKGFGAWLVLVLGAATVVPIPTDDKPTAFIAGAVVSGIHALISLIKRLVANYLEAQSGKSKADKS